MWRSLIKPPPSIRPTLVMRTANRPSPQRNHLALSRSPATLLPTARSASSLSRSIRSLRARSESTASRSCGDLAIELPLSNELPNDSTATHTS